MPTMKRATLLAAVDRAPRGLRLAAAVGVGVDVLGQQLDEALGVAVLRGLEEAVGQLLVGLAVDLEARALGVDVAPRAGTSWRALASLLPITSAISSYG